MINIDFQFGHFLEGSLKCHRKSLSTEGNEPGNFVANLIRISESPGHIADSSPRRMSRKSSPPRKASTRL